jgi:TonB family protein
MTHRSMTHRSLSASADFSKSRDYRSQLNAQHNRTLWFCLTLAALVHGGAIATISLPNVLAKSADPSQPKDQVKPPEPIEFVYIEPNKTVPPVVATQQTQRYAQIDAIAGGEHNPQKAVNAGKAVASKVRKPVMPTDEKVAIAEKLTVKGVAPATAQSRSTSAKPDLAPDLAPNLSTAKQKAMSETMPETIPAKPSQPIEAAKVDDKSEVAPNATTETVMTDREGAFSVQRPQRPFLQAERSPFPQPSPSPLRAAVREGEVTPTAPEPQSGAGNSGSANSNRDVVATGSVDAKRDPIWADYDATVKTLINDRWKVETDSIVIDQDLMEKIGSDRQAHCIVRLTINAQGQMLRTEMVESSGIERFDQAALAVIETVKLPVFPARARNQSIILTQKFEHNFPSEETAEEIDDQ